MGAMTAGIWFAPAALAAPPAAGAAAKGPDFTVEGIIAIFTRLACYASRIALLLVTAFIIFYGVQFLMSEGNPEKVTQAKKSLLWGIVGVAVILGTYTIIATVANSIGADFSPTPLSC